jgi:16S rRNA (cytidine1402-2'-O)-methyltransferase
MKTRKKIKREKNNLEGKQVNSKEEPKGILYICATPIGNLQDITLRTLECLRTADLIAVESFNRSRKLLNYYGIKSPLISYRESNREKQGREIIEGIKKGRKVVFITDAGMPLVSDPGFNLLQLMVKEKLDFTVVPGPSAVLTALVRAGYPAGKFVFWGFLSRTKNERLQELNVLSAEEKAVIIYESPYRLLNLLREAATILGDRELAVCRELTKKFEEVKRGAPLDLLQHFEQKPPRGEITIVISPLTGDKKRPGKKPAPKMTPDLLKEAKGELAEAIAKGIPPAEAVKKVSKALLLPKNKVYAVMLQLKSANTPWVKNEGPGVRHGKNDC